MGRALIPGLMTQGFQVSVFCLPGDPGILQLPSEVKVIEGDITQLPDDLLKGVGVVYHLAAIILAPNDELSWKINFEGTKSLLEQSCKYQVGRFIYISSASVVYPHLTIYGQTKLESEKLVRESSLNWTIVRPTLLYDEAGSLEYNVLLKHLKKWPVLPLPGGGTSLKRPIYSGDLTDPLVKMAHLEGVSGKIYALAGQETLSFREICEISKTLANFHCILLPIPLFLAKPAIRILQWIRRSSVSPQQALAGFIYDADLDISLAEKDLNFKPRGFSEGIQDCLPRE